MQHLFTCFTKIPLLALLLACHLVNAQVRKTENLVIVVLDGMRWQEIFTGADSLLINDPAFTSTRNKDRVTRKFWHTDPVRRREKLMPFLWKTVAQGGQLHGNRHYGNLADVTNPYRMTYPGFSEMLTGYADPAITSNRLVTSTSDNVLEFIHQQPGYAGKVAVFTTSDLFPFLLNKKKSKLYINADSDSLAFAERGFQLLNEMQQLTVKPTTERPDLLTYFAAREYVKAFKPKVLYLALGETDAFAHAGQYDQYLETAHGQDRMVAALWEMIQAMPEYAGKTTLVLTCDHGRGEAIREQWITHGPQVNDSGQIWAAVLGPDTPVKGEVRVRSQLYQAQLAATFAALLGMDFRPETHRAMPPFKPFYQP